MTSRTRRLAFTAGFVVLFALTLWSWVPSKAVSEGKKAPAEAALEPVGAEPASEDVPLPAPQHGGRQSYAIGLHDLSGLSRDTAPGTVVDLWVAWDPPITDTPQYQRLIPSVIVEEIEPPFVPEGPFTVVLSVPRKKIGDLLYADRYGAISVTTPSQE